VSQITVDAWGAQGAPGIYLTGGYPSQFGGLGGHIQTTLQVTPGSTLFLYVGGVDGGNGGGLGSGTAYGFGGNGGDGSDVRLGNAYNSRLLTAGGGGGGGIFPPEPSFVLVGGSGGGNTGASAPDNLASSGSGGGGGSQTAAGADGIFQGFPVGTPGGLGTGGNAASGTSSGGGGGGFYGGGSGTWAGGGGGSSFAYVLASTSINAQGVNTGLGLITISYNVDTTSFAPTIYISDPLCPNQDTPGYPNYPDNDIRCSGCQYCPDGSICPACNPLCPNQLVPGYPNYPNNDIRCSGCQYCPDGSICPACPNPPSTQGTAMPSFAVPKPSLITDRRLCAQVPGGPTYDVWCNGCQMCPGAIWCSNCQNGSCCPNRI